MGEQWQTISEDKFSIEFDAPDLIGGPRTFLYNLDRGGYHKKFLGRWAGRAPKFARAEMFVMSLGAGYLFTADPDLKKMVRRSTPTKDISFKEEGRLKNSLGNVKYLRYAIASDECVGFYLYAGKIREADNVSLLRGDTIIDGTYCAGPGQPMTENDLQSVLNAIRFKDQAAIIEEKLLTSAEMVRLISKFGSRGVTVDGVSADGYDSVALYLRPDGTIAGRSKEGDTDIGQWSAENDTLCTQWQKWEGGERRCSKIYKVGEKYKRYDLKGNFKSTLSNERGGNAENIAYGVQGPQMSPSGSTQRFTAVRLTERCWL